MQQPTDATSESATEDRRIAQRQVEGAIERLLRLQQSRRVHGELMTASQAQLSQPGVILLLRLRGESGLTVGELAKLAHMDMSLVSRELRKLETDGYIARSADKADGRVSRVALTQSGTAVVRRLRRVRDRHVDETLAGWSVEELQQLGSLMSRFVDDMQSVHYRG